MLKVLLTVFAISFLNFSIAAPTDAEPKKSIWSISIFRGPAPSAEEGPPASANALRDPSTLKFELIGIAGAYLLWLTFLSVFLFVARRKYSHRQRATIPPAMDMYKSTGRVTLQEIQAGPKSPLGPKSPGKMSSIRSWAKGHKGRQSEISVSTVNTRVDERVIEDDRARNMDEMAKLYAAVMLHDQERASSKTNSADSSPITDPDVPPTPRSPRCPPELAHHAYYPPMTQDYPPMPEEYHQTYPSQYEPQNHYQPLHFQPQHFQPQRQYEQQHYQTQHQYEQQHYDAVPEPPLPTNNDREALLDTQASPRKNKPGALSIISSTASRLNSSQSNKARPSPITVRGQAISKPLGSADLRQSAFSPSQASFQQSYTPGLPPPTPGRGHDSRPVEEFEMHGRPQIISPPPIPDDIVKTTKALPFRQYYKESLQSAPATKTTFLDRRTSAFNGPKTGVPKTPYSPYCPTTPMTPVTPRRLPGKEELKKNKKQYALQAVRENEMVQTDDDMWGK